MGNDHRVVWSEGLFLCPQHFQQHDRWVDWLTGARAGWAHDYPWGLRRLEIDTALLETGKIGLARAQGIFPDGTPFDIPAQHEAPPALEVAGESRGQRVFLTVPLRREGSPSVGAPEQGLFRFLPAEQEVADENAGFDLARPVAVAKPRLGLAFGTEPPDGHAALGLARVQEIRADGVPVLDPDYIPPLLSVHASTRLRRFLTELRGLLRHRMESLAGRLSEAGQGGVAEIADFLLLEVVNRYEPLIAHLEALPVLHGERLYHQLLALAGELATFARADRCPPAFPAYDHEDPQTAYDPVLVEIREGLSKVILERAIPIPLHARQYGFHVAPVTDRSLLQDASIVLAARADLDPETLRRQFVTQVKVGPVEKIQEFVKLALPGIRLVPLQVAPRQIPYHAGHHYFELDRSSEYWKDLQHSAAIALHVGGRFPGLKMELWAVRE